MYAFLSVNPAECCMPYEEEDMGMSYGEEDTCMHSSVSIKLYMCTSREKKCMCTPLISF
jgi:hypothetical protein